MPWLNTKANQEEKRESNRIARNVWRRNHCTTEIMSSFLFPWSANKRALPKHIANRKSPKHRSSNIPYELQHFQGLHISCQSGSPVGILAFFFPWGRSSNYACPARHSFGEESPVHFAPKNASSTPWWGWKFPGTRSHTRRSRSFISFSFWQILNKKSI